MRSELQWSWGDWGRCKPLSGNFRWRIPLRKLLGSKEHLEWLTIDLNVTEILLFNNMSAPRVNVN